MFLKLSRSQTAAAATESLTGSEREGRRCPTPRGISHHIPDMSSVDNEKGEYVLNSTAPLAGDVIHPSIYGQRDPALVWTLRRRRGSNQYRGKAPSKLFLFLPVLFSLWRGGTTGQQVTKHMKTLLSPNISFFILKRRCRVA